jgi:hypothetical protein
LLGFQGVAVMNFRLAILFCLVLNLESAASAQQSQNRIDLSADGGAPLPPGAASPPAISGIAFRPADVVCPEEHGAIEIRSGQMYLTRINSENQARSNKLPGDGLGGRFHAKPLDDETYQYEIGNEQCRLVLQVRLQTQRDGEWQPVLLPYWSRPSVSKEERSARARQLRNFFNEHRGRGKAESQPRPPPPPGPQMLGDVSGSAEGFFFEGLSEATLADCFQAVGTYEVNQEGVFFTFLRTLPGNVNRFAIERNDINNYQGRLSFVQDGCRVQITTSGSWKYNFEWAPLVLNKPI